MQISEPAEYAMLGLLEDRPMHGYEMFQQFESGTLRQIVHLEMSQMYAYLKKLERLEYIEAELEPQGVRPPRKIFHLTEPGRSKFLDHLESQRLPNARTSDTAFLDHVVLRSRIHQTRALLDWLCELQRDFAETH